MDRQRHIGKILTKKANIVILINVDIKEDKEH